MNFIYPTGGPFIDRKELEPELEPIDILIPTLDAETFLERCLFSIFREIPVNNLIICDGGSKDNTVNILKKFPRTEIYVRSDIRTTGKVMEFLISKCSTEWFVVIDSDIEISDGWYDEMKKFENKFDAIENSNEVIAYHSFRQNKPKLEENQRSYDMCHLIKKDALKDYKCDDDFMWRYTDYFIRQTIEKSGFKYGKISSTMHINNESERIKYASDSEKNYSELVWKEPEIRILDKDKEREIMIKNAKAIIKYLDPESILVKNNRGLSSMINILDRDWIKTNGSKWLDVYDLVNSKKYKIKRKLFLFLNRNKSSN